MTYYNPSRNFKNLQYQILRDVIDKKYNAAHDTLSAAYYNEVEYGSYGLLTKEEFDVLHGLIFAHRSVELKKENDLLLDKYSDVMIEEAKIEAEKFIAECEKVGVTLEIK